MERITHCAPKRIFLHLLDESVGPSYVATLRYTVITVDLQRLAMAMDHIGKDFHILHWERQALYTLYRAEQISPMYSFASVTCRK